MGSGHPPIYPAFSQGKPMSLHASKPTTYYLVTIGCLVILLLLLATSSGKPEIDGGEIESAGLSSAASPTRQGDELSTPPIPSWASREVRIGNIRASDNAEDRSSRTDPATPCCYG